ncbi:hypothetical protein, partial [Demequina sp.]|uniref:hypothetical protein n=1 Tax=Demequina sp. TaxID=2050685 RepID=UPI003D0D6416
IEKAMAEGVTKDEAFLWSVYETLFNGIKGIFAPTSERTAYTYAELGTTLPRYEGTSPAAYKEKLRNKAKRANEYYNRKGIKVDVPPNSLPRKVVRRAKRLLKKLR